MFLIAAFTASEHRRLIWLVVVYALVLAVLGPWVADLALGAPVRALRDLGLGLGWLVGCGCAIGLGTAAFGVHLRSRAPAWWLTGPVSRRSWWTGRALGALGLLLAVVTGLTAVHAAVELWVTGPPPADLFGWALLLWAECALLLALSALLSLLLRPGAAVTASLGLWAAGHLATEHAAATAQQPWFSRLVFTVLPDLDRLVVHTALIHGDALDPARLGWGLAYAGSWTVGLLALGIFVMERVDPM